MVCDTISSQISVGSVSNLALKPTTPTGAEPSLLLSSIDQEPYTRSQETVNDGLEVWSLMEERNQASKDLDSALVAYFGDINTRKEDQSHYTTLIRVLSALLRITRIIVTRRILFPSLSSTDIVLSIIRHIEAESSLSLIYVGRVLFKGNQAALTLVLLPRSRAKLFPSCHKQSFSGYTSWRYPQASFNCNSASSLSPGSAYCCFEGPKDPSSLEHPR